MRDFHFSDLRLLTKKSMNYVSNVFGNEKTNRLFAQQSVGAFCHAHSEFLIYNKCLRNILCVKIYLQLKLRPKIVAKSFNYYFNFSLIIHEPSLIHCMLFESGIHACICAKNSENECLMKVLNEF